MALTLCYVYFLFLVVRASLVGKHARSKVGTTSWRASGAEDDVLSPAPLFGPVRAISPSPPEQGQDPPTQAAAIDNVGDQVSPTRGVPHVLPLPPAEPMVVFLGEGTRDAGILGRSEPAVGQPCLPLQLSGLSFSRKRTRDSSLSRPKGTAEMVKIIFFLFVFFSILSLSFFSTDFFLLLLFFRLVVDRGYVSAAPCRIGKGARAQGTS